MGSNCARDAAGAARAKAIIKASEREETAIMSRLPKRVSLLYSLRIVSRRGQEGQNHDPENSRTDPAAWANADLPLEAGDLASYRAASACHFEFFAESPRMHGCSRAG